MSGEGTHTHTRTHTRTHTGQREELVDTGPRKQTDNTHTHTHTHAHTHAHAHTHVHTQDRERNLWILDPANKLTIGRSTQCDVVVKENASCVSRTHLFLSVCSSYLSLVLLSSRDNIMSTRYGVATISRLLKIIGLFHRIQSLL